MICESMIRQDQRLLLKAGRRGQSDIQTTLNPMYNLYNLYPLVDFIYQLDLNIAIEIII